MSSTCSTPGGRNQPRPLQELLCRPVRVVDNEVPWGNNSQRVKGKASELAAKLLSEDRVVNVDEQADLIQHNEWNTQL